MLTRNEIINQINTDLHTNIEVTTNLYRNKCYVLADCRIKEYFKTKRGAEGYIKRNSSFSYYDDYIQDLVYPNASLEIFEIKQSEIVDYKTNKMIWYLELREIQSITYMYNNMECIAKKHLTNNEELLNYVLETIEGFRNGKGLLVYEEKQEETEIIEEVKEEEVETKVAEQQENNNNTTNSIKVEINFNSDKDGIELKFNSKPDEEVRAQLKENGFRWSRYKKIWFAKDTEERRNFVNTLNNQEQQENTITEKTKEIEIVELNPINAENFPISKELSKRENEGHWTFRTKERDHQQEILDTLNNYYNVAKEVINSTNNINIINSINIYCNRFNKKYYNNYLKRLINNANNPSWAVTGRAGRNMNKYNKMNSRYDNLMRELISLEDEFENKIFYFENKIQTSERKEYFKEVEQCTTKLNFKRSKIKINVNTLDNYFNIDDNLNTIETQLYTVEYNNTKYHLIKSWGRYEAINDTGNTIGLLRVKNLEMAKQMLTHYILKQNEKISV